jgi:xanthine dehydrogenase accessory factor
MRNVDLQTGDWRYQDTDNAAQVSLTNTHFLCVHGPRWRLLIIGASEIAVYLAEIAKTLDFAVTIVEPREAYRDAWRIADTTLMQDMPDDAVVMFKPDAHSVIVAVSHDPKLDDMALMAALKTPAFYVGAVGSIKTSEARRERLQTLDVTASEVAKLHGPVGFDIGSRTPPEIAVAIAAELIATRNTHKRVTST